MLKSARRPADICKSARHPVSITDRCFTLTCSVSTLCQELYQTPDAILPCSSLLKIGVAVLHCTHGLPMYSMLIRAMYSPYKSLQHNICSPIAFPVYTIYNTASTHHIQHIQHCIQHCAQLQRISPKFSSSNVDFHHNTEQSHPAAHTK